MTPPPLPNGWLGDNGRGIVIENIGGSALEARGGTYVGGNVKGIDGTLGIADGDVLVQFKSHDVTDDQLPSKVRTAMERLRDLDPVEIQGTTRRVGGSPGIPFRYDGTPAARVVVIAVPRSQMNYIISPGFISKLNQFAEELRVVPIVKPVGNWRSSR